MQHQSKLPQYPTCNATGCSGGTFCLWPQEGYFKIDNVLEALNVTDNLSGTSSYYDYTSVVYDKNGKSTVADGGGCLSSKGHHPCQYVWYLTFYDNVGNSMSYTINNTVSYLLNDNDYPKETGVSKKSLCQR